MAFGEASLMERSKHIIVSTDRIGRDIRRRQHLFPRFRRVELDTLGDQRFRSSFAKRMKRVHSSRPGGRKHLEEKRKRWRKPMGFVDSERAYQVDKQTPC